MSVCEIQQTACGHKLTQREWPTARERQMNKRGVKRPEVRHFHSSVLASGQRECIPFSDKAAGHFDTLYKQ